MVVPFERWRNNFVQTAPDAVRDMTYGLLRPMPFACLRESLSAADAATPGLPITYLVSSQDLTLPQGEEWWAEKYAARLGVEPVAFEACHAAHLTDPVLVADQLPAAAKA
ncbi:hypothetical protein [Streptomyces sp. NPDC059862]|uniref:hypothetical protein n=1 Tax=unclassified Streptomyces TaxID=2593676 RepID=UPI003644EBA5